MEFVRKRWLLRRHLVSVIGGLVILSSLMAGGFFGCGIARQMAHMHGMMHGGGHGTEHGGSGAPALEVGNEVICPVSGKRFRPPAPKAEYEGKVYYFFSEEDKEKFLSSPAIYVKPGEEHTGHPR